MSDTGRLIVKLPYPLCAKCTDALNRASEPVRYSQHELVGYSTSYNPREENKPQWTWTWDELAKGAERCKHCRFLRDVLAVNPNLSKTKPEEDDLIVLASVHAGSAHHETLYDRHYRPKLQIVKRKAGYAPFSRSSTWILPLLRSVDTGEGRDVAELFHGRKVEETVSFPVIRHWLQMCQKHHTGSSDASSSTTALGQHARPHPSQREKSSCRPRTKCTVPNFRLIDVCKECVVAAAPSDEYAALSYVWGSAKRLILSNETWDVLTKPGALSSGKSDVPQTFQDALLVANRLGVSHIWIDALCIRQDNEEELISHMDSMDSIYSSAIVTIVSNSESADAGIPGISCRRKIDQVVVKLGAKELISTKKTFSEAMQGSPWESRGWTLQEKVFSNRLLIFTESQAFYHCSEATWFEDTVLELRHRSPSATNTVLISEQPRPWQKRKAGTRAGSKAGTMAYETSRPLFPRQFWDLVKVYVQRDLSFDNDIIRAFNGILRSISPPSEPAIWGIPQSWFSNGLSWYFIGHVMSARRNDFPSWSWAGWKRVGRTTLHFIHTRLDRTRLKVQWYYHQRNGSGRYDLVRMDADGHETWWKDLNWTYELPDHPGGPTYNDSPMPLFDYSARVMPPISHIVRFWTSSASLFISREPLTQVGASYATYDHPAGHTDTDTLPERCHYEVGISSTRERIFDIYLGKQWRDTNGDMGEFIVVSPGVDDEFLMTEGVPEDDDQAESAFLNVMLIEWSNGIASRVDMVGTPIEMGQWRRTKPIWKLITMA